MDKPLVHIPEMLTAIVCLLVSSCTAPVAPMIVPTVAFQTTESSSSPTPLPSEPPTPIPSPQPSAILPLSSTPAPTPPVFHLEADGSGDYPTLEEAVKSAPDSSTILLGAGVFRLEEALDIEKPLSLIGQGMDKTEIVSSSAEYTVHVKVSGSFKIKGITFRHEGREFADALDIEEAQVAIESCRFTGGAMNPNTVTTATDQNCPEQCIHNRRGGGLRLREKTTGYVKDNLAEENFTGIWVFGQNITLERNLVSKNKAGMAFGASSTALASQNQVKENEYNGFVIAMAANPTLEENTSSNNGDNGFLFTGEATGNAIRNVCESNKRSGMWIEDRAAPILEENLCTKNGENGFVYQEDSAGKANFNQCSDNQMNGIQVIGNAHPELESNICNHNIIYGIVIAENAHVEAHNNECNENQRTGILITDSARATLEENSCIGNAKFGIAVGINSIGILRKNTCRENQKHGILVAENASATLEENSCNGNLQAGIAFIDNSQGSATRNACSANETGIFVAASANPELLDNDCHDNTLNDILDER